MSEQNTDIIMDRKFYSTGTWIEPRDRLYPTHTKASFLLSVIMKWASLKWMNIQAYH